MADESVVICECFARDGLQHEPEFVSTADKLRMLDAIGSAGFRRIEASSYSHPQRVPAFADVSELMAGLSRRAGVAYKNTCPNQRAVQRALDDKAAGRGADELSLLVSASESHSQRNLRSTRAEQWERIGQMVELAAGHFTLVGVISVAFGCPFEGAVDPAVVAEDAARFSELGVDYVTVGDTTGLADPISTRSLFRRVMAEAPAAKVVAHFHNTRGTGLANVVAALEVGVRHLDSAIGGVGGHPSTITYGQGKTGNVCTEDLVNMLESMGVRTGIDLDALTAASALAEEILRRPLSSMVARAGWSDLITDREVSHV